MSFTQIYQTLQTPQILQALRVQCPDTNWLSGNFKGNQYISVTEVDRSFPKTFLTLMQLVEDPSGKVELLITGACPTELADKIIRIVKEHVPDDRLTLILHSL